MLKKTLTYTDFDGIERKEDFYFNLTEAELTDMQLSKEGGMNEYLQRIVNSKNTAQLIETFKEIVLKAYGEKSEDGRRFMKSDEIRRNFEATQAYSDIYMELVLDDEAAIKFIEGVMPNVENLEKKIKLRLKESKGVTSE